jgi:hypothetical protein
MKKIIFLVGIVLLLYPSVICYAQGKKSVKFIFQPNGTSICYTVFTRGLFSGAIREHWSVANQPGEDHPVKTWGRLEVDEPSEVLIAPWNGKRYGKLKPATDSNGWPIIIDPAD